MVNGAYLIKNSYQNLVQQPIFYFLFSINYLFPCKSIKNDPKTLLNIKIKDYFCTIKSTWWF